MKKMVTVNSTSYSKLFFTKHDLETKKMVGQTMIVFCCFRYELIVLLLGLNLFAS